MDLAEKENGEIAHLTTTEASDNQPGSAELGANSYYTGAGYEVNTHLLLNLDVGPSPGILLIRKSINEQETYLGLLSFIFKW